MLLSHNDLDASVALIAKHLFSSKTLQFVIKIVLICYVSNHSLNLFLVI